MKRRTLAMIVMLPTVAAVTSVVISVTRAEELGSATPPAAGPAAATQFRQGDIFNLPSYTAPPYNTYDPYRAAPSSAYPAVPAPSPPSTTPNAAAARAKLSREMWARIALARHKLARAATDDERATLQAELEKLLGEYFDGDLAMRGKELAAIQKRVADMQAQFDKRRAAKSDIISLQLKIFANEAEGLGLFGSDIGTDPSGVKASTSVAWPVPYTYPEAWMKPLQENSDLPGASP